MDKVAYSNLCSSPRFVGWACVKIMKRSGAAFTVTNWRGGPNQNKKINFECINWRNQVFFLKRRFNDARASRTETKKQSHVVVKIGTIFSVLSPSSAHSCLNAQLRVRSPCQLPIRISIIMQIYDTTKIRDEGRAVLWDWTSWFPRLHF